MSGPRTPSRASSYGSINTTGTTDSQDAALLGAAKAFGRPPPKPRAPSNTYAGANGALKAATSVNPSGKAPSPKHGHGSSPGALAGPSSPTGSVRSVQSTQGSARKDVPTLDAATMPSLAVPKQDMKARSKSPSQRAAQLAAARSPEPYIAPATTRPRAKTTHKPAVAPKPRRLSDRFSLPNSPTDDSPIQPTTSLVQMFERKSSNPGTPSGASKPLPHPITASASRDLPLRSPKPARMPDGGITSVFQMELGEGKNAPASAGDIAAKDHAAHAQHDGQSSSDDYVSASEDKAAASSPITIPKRDSRAPSIASEDASTAGSPVARPMRPSPSPLRHTSTQPMQIQQVPSRSTTSPPEMFSASSQSGRSIAAQYNMLHPRRVTPLHTGDELANAIVASSLASSRAPSPRKMEPPPVPTRRQKHHRLGFSRTPSPVKTGGMRHTLRKEESTEEESEDGLHPYSKHKKKRLVRKHPNKHHEGDRKRWREAVTERERKRYEGVWAANKGLHIAFTPDEEQEFQRGLDAEEVKARRAAAADQVSGVVARDIWSRSRLPDTALGVVWDLVDNDGVGRLSKEEFVVGMWLIDQRLKGRKLPTRVSESVWASVRRVQGVRVRQSKMH